MRVAALDEVKRYAEEAFRDAKQGSRITFATPELPVKLLTSKRWELLRAVTGTGPINIREAGRRVTREVKAVHADVQALLKAGVLQKTDTGRVVLPYKAVRLDVRLHAV